MKEAKRTAELTGTSKEEIMKKAYELGFGYERDFGNCPQCVIAALQDIFGEVDNEVFKAGYGLAGGGALLGQGTCGALCGAMMVISSLFGRERERFDEKPRKAYRLSKRVFESFVHEFGSCICRDVQVKMMGRSFNLWDKDDYQAFEEAGGHIDKCPHVVGKTAAWAAGMLWEEYCY
ncbi:MAG: C-GCAxxG-C-C family protein [Peptococcaceae bacterium]|nr:C-GCAxxG-C-C family protein [Peptococcaceae bacterium]MDH7524882.1 C-GCAxxG-C-C family protein [Peptococcaceae bacterium]